MAKANKRSDREELLADIAEYYYIGGKTQAEISKTVGMTRSAISRLLTEARQKGVVEINIRRPLRFESELETAMMERFGLVHAHVVSCQPEHRYDVVLNRLGRAGARVLADYMASNTVFGIAWGSTVKEVIESFQPMELDNVTVVQLVGVLGSTRNAYSGQALVDRMAQKVNGEGIYLYTPFIVESEETARVLLNDQSVQTAVAAGRKCEIALLGVGSTDPEYCSLYQGGHMSKKDLDILVKAGAVGDVGSHYFKIDGKIADVEFNKRMVGIAKDDLMKIPTRLVVGGGVKKAHALLGGARGGYFNVLITDSQTAELMLTLDEQSA